MRFRAFSPRQREAMGWWTPGSPHAGRDAVICDGAIRSGKTLAMGIGFFLWAMREFAGESFALCGKTMSACERNVVVPMLGVLREFMGLEARYSASKGLLEVRGDGVSNRFYVFGGRDEGSYALIQGLTLAGVLLDEVALMPRSFVEQAVARCSVEGSRFWFNCNPQGPGHWFYREWILGAEEKNAVRLHFGMDDNPSLSAGVMARYHKLFSGVFYDRHVLGQWVKADGLVYPMFDPARHVYDEEPEGRGRWFVSVDYGTRNPFAAGLWRLSGGVASLEREYYHDARVAGRQMDDEQYYQALCTLAGEAPVERVLVDPSALSFIQCVHNHGRFSVWRADNAVLDGVRNVASALESGWLRVHASCVNTIREFGEYVWDEGAAEDRPRKENDHAMDALRYFVQSVLVHEKKWR